MHQQMISAQAGQHIPVQAAQFIPLAVIGLVLFSLGKWGRGPVWEMVTAVLAGVILTGTILGPEITVLLSQLSGGRLH